MTAVLCFIHTVSPFNIDGEFSISAVERLEAAGVPVITSINKRLNRTRIMQMLNLEMQQFPDHVWERLCTWQTLFAVGDNPRHRTWGSLFQVLRELDLKELGEEIEVYLTNDNNSECYQLCSRSDQAGA